MVERIDILLPPASRCGYGVLPYFSRAFLAALQRCGVSCRLLGSEDGPTPNLVSQLLLDPPDCTLSFNGLLPDEAGDFFCERLQIPHVACLVDSPNKYLSMVQSKLNIVTSIDRDWAQFFLDLRHDTTLWMPHAVDKDYHGDPESERPYEVLFAGTCLDIDELRESWKTLFSPGLCAVLDSAAERTLADQNTSYLRAFNYALEERMRLHGDVDTQNLDLPDALDNLEFLIRGRDRLALLRALKDVQVHVFGTKSGSNGWEKYLQGASSNIIFHGRLSYPETLDMIKKSKVVINSCPSIRAGAHERIFAGFLGGAAVLTNDCSYIRTLFTADEELLLYRHGHYDAINQQLADLIANESRRREIVHRASQKVLAQHTWDHRAKALLAHLDKVLPAVLQQL